MLNELIDYLGQPEKESGGHRYWQCPFCRDKGKDNLIYTESKNLVKCFADPDHATLVLKEINKRKPKEEKQDYKREERKKPEFNMEEGILYWCEKNEELIKDPRALAFLEKTRGIKKHTVKTLGIGFDRKNKKWVLPVLGMDGALKGFEYRPPDFKVFKYPPDNPPKCRKEPGTPSILSQIGVYIENESEVLVIIEGFLDGYIYWQFLQEKGIKGYHVVTPSNGVGTTLSSIEKEKEIFSRYKQVVIFLDNDPPGQKETEKIIKAYPDFKPMKLKCGCEDFTDHYMKCKEKKK